MKNDQAALDEMQLNVMSRLNKIMGQLKGISNMIESGKECEDILIQVKAVRSALKAMSAIVIKRYMIACYKESNASPEELEKLEKMVSVLSRFMD